MTKQKRFINGGFNHWPITPAVFRRRWRYARRTALWAMTTQHEHRAFYMGRRAEIVAMRSGVDFGTRAKRVRQMVWGQP